MIQYIAIGINKLILLAIDGSISLPHSLANKPDIMKYVPYEFINKSSDPGKYNLWRYRTLTLGQREEGNGPIYNGEALETFKVVGNSSGEWLHWCVHFVKIYKAAYL